jgi:hypothetical protein
VPRVGGTPSSAIALTFDIPYRNGQFSVIPDQDAIKFECLGFQASATVNALTLIVAVLDFLDLEPHHVDRLASSPL